MTNALLPTQPQQPPRAGLGPVMTEAHARRFEAYETGRRAPATIAVYNRLSRAFADWCAGQQLSACPAHPQTVWAYMDSLVTRPNPIAQATLTSIKAAIQYQHERQRQPDPFSDGLAGKTLTLQFEGMRRALAGRRPRRATALSLEQLEAIFEAINTGEPVGLRDAAAIAVAIFNADRRSEIVGLLLEDVAWSETGALITLRRSKTDQLGQGATLIAPMAEGLIDPGGLLRGWVDWLAGHGVTKGPLMREVRRTREGWVPVDTGKPGDGISGGWFNTALKTYARAAGIELPPEAHLSSHSLRRSAATLVARAGATTMQTAQFGRWTDPRTIQRVYLQDDADERIKLAKQTFSNQ